MALLVSACSRPPLANHDAAAVLQPDGAEPTDAPADTGPIGDAMDAPRDQGSGDDQTLAPLGAPCASGAGCRSGFCADGVCCDTGCTGVCMTCALPGSIGRCGPVRAGADPRGQCEDQGAATCGQTGTCNGAGACGVYAAGTICAAPSCADGATASLARRCDGAGTCAPGATNTCTPFACDGATGACKSICEADRDCVPGARCVNGTCGGGDARPCVRDAECASGHCAQGVCCSTSCDGTCMSCALANSVGTCRPVPAGEDPLNQCTPTDVSTCGLDGTCDGQGACRMYAPGTSCQAASCAGTTLTTGGVCDGAGLCRAGSPLSCGPYICDPSRARCRESCDTDGDCAAPNVCVNHVCSRRATGPCASDAECASGHCAQGTCCDTACDGTCLSCALVGHAGICTPVPAGQDPLGHCTQDSPATCGYDGTCNGQGACRLYPSGTQCAAATCLGTTYTAPRVCDGAGTCRSGVSSSCAPYACGVSSCRFPCSTSNDCIAGYRCDPLTRACVVDSGAGTN